CRCRWCCRRICHLDSPFIGLGPRGISRYRSSLSCKACVKPNPGEASLLDLLVLYGRAGRLKTLFATNRSRHRDRYVALSRDSGVVSRHWVFVFEERDWWGGE